MNRKLLGIDNGGSDIKCALFDEEGRELASAAVQVPISVPAPGFTERDPEKIWEANLEAIRRVLREADADPSEIAAVGLTAYGNGMILTDENIRPVYPAIVSTDDRAAALVQQFKADGTEARLFPYTRQTLWSAQPAVLLPWFQRNCPEVLEKTRWILSLKDYLRYRLTGDLHGELTEASSTSLVALDKKDYDRRLFEILGIPECLEKFPPLLESTAVAGTLNAETAALCGLKEGTPVAAGYFDIDANALASGILNDEELCLIAGTWSINEYLTKEATDEYEKRTNTATLSYLDGLYLMEDSTPTSAGNFNWYIEKILKAHAPALGNPEIYAYCNEAVAAKDPAESEAVFVPYLFASATAPQAQGAFLGLRAGDDEASLIRAIYEGVVFSSVHHVHNLQRPLDSYRIAKLSGGITNSDVWSQMMADALQIPVQTLKGSQTGAKGAAIGAGVACGLFKDLEEAAGKMVRYGRIYEPRREYAAVYQKKYRRYEAALKAVDLLAGEGEVS